MEAALEVFLGILLSSTLTVPIILFIVGLIVGLKPGKAFRSGLITSVALTGLWTILELFMNNISPIAMAIGEKFGGAGAFEYVDVGWTARFAAGFSTIGLSYVGIGILLNLVLVMLGWIKTLSIEFIGPILANSTIGYAIYLTTGSYVYGLIASTIIFVINWILCDWQQPMVEKFYGYKNISFITVGVNEVGIIAWPLAKLLDLIPGLKQSKFTPEWISQKLGVFGEPMFIGAAFGLALGLIAGNPVVDSLNLAVVLAASLNLMPRMIGVLMEGLVPIQEGLRDWLKKNTKDREIYIGMDPALGTGHPAVLATTMLIIPVTVLLAVLLPGNRVLPMADLAVLVFTLEFVVIMNKGDLLRSFISSVIIMVLVIYGANLDAPFLTMTLQDQGVIEEGMKVANTTAGAVPYTWVFAKIWALLGLGG